MKNALFAQLKRLTLKD